MLKDLKVNGRREWRECLACLAWRARMVSLQEKSSHDSPLFFKVGLLSVSPAASMLPGGHISHLSLHIGLLFE